MEDSSRLGVIGGGNMGSALVSRLISEGVFKADDVRVADIVTDRLTELSEKYGVTAASGNADAVAEANTVILAIKPQVILSVLQDISSNMKSDALVISIVPGWPVDVLSAHLGVTSIVRAIPNTPSIIGQGTVVWTASENTSDAQRRMAEDVFSVLGKSFWVSDEKFLDMTVAISGSGPSYFYYISEALVDAAVHLGWPRELSEEIILRMLKGSASYALESGKHLSRLRNEVTSQGGTSAAAIYEFDKAGLRATMSKAVLAAYSRAVALGRSTGASQHD